VLELRGGSRFTLEALDCLSVGHDLEWQHLDRNIAIQLALPRTIYDSHRTATDLFEDIIVRDERAVHDVEVALHKVA